MLPVKTILCPVDFSGPSFEALNAASELASHFGAALVLVHVVPVLPPMPSDPNWVMKIPEYELLLHQDAEEKMKQVVEQRLAKDLIVQSIIGHGDAAAEIVRIAGHERADLIVIATHGESGWRRWWFGSVAEKVVRNAPLPVLTIRGKIA